MRHICWILAALLLIGCGTAAPTASNSDIVITERGCSASQFTLAATREPLVQIDNQSDSSMVFTIPKINRWIAVAPGEQADFELPRYLMGSFDFFCLSEADHTAVSGGNPYLCSLEPAELLPVARSSGMFEIEAHNRIQEVLAPQATPGQP